MNCDRLIFLSKLMSCFTSPTRLLPGGICKINPTALTKVPSRTSGRYRKWDITVMSHSTPTKDLKKKTASVSGTFYSDTPLKWTGQQYFLSFHPSTKEKSLQNELIHHTWPSIESSIFIYFSILSLGWRLPAAVRSVSHLQACMKCSSRAFSQMPRHGTGVWEGGLGGFPGLAW